MDNQTNDLKLGKDKKRLSQTRKEKSAKRAQENTRKKNASSWINTDPRIVCKSFICLSFFNLKVDIIFVTLNKLNILLEVNFDLYSSK